MSSRRLTLRRVQSSFVRAVGYVALAPDFRREHPGKGLLVVEFKGGSTRVYLADSWLPGVLLAPQTSVGKVLNRYVLHGAAQGAGRSRSDYLGS